MYLPGCGVCGSSVGSRRWRLSLGLLFMHLTFSSGVLLGSGTGRDIVVYIPGCLVVVLVFP